MSETEPPEGPDTGEFSEFFRTADLPEQSSRPASHRGALQPAPILGRLLAPATAVVVVIVVILLLIWINGSSSGSNQSPAAVGPGPAQTPTHAIVPPSTRPSATTASSHSAKPSHSPTAVVVPPKPRHKPRPKPTTHKRPAMPKAMAPVEVLNNSRRTGLAHEVAAQVQDRGWTISQVGNLQGLVPESTVYYAAGDEAAAEHLEAEFSSIRRIEPNSEGNLHGSALTLVVTGAWVL